MKMKILILIVICASARILFQDDFENGLTNFNTDTTSGQITDCPLRPTSKCLQLTKKVAGGDLFTNPFENPTSPADPTQNYITVQFEYFSKNYPNKPANSSLVVGATYEDESKYFWVAMGDLSTIPERVPYAIQIIDSVEQWKLIRFIVKPDELKRLMIVFQDFLYIQSTPGNYFLDNLLVTFGNDCATGCKTCSNYLACDLCQPEYLSLSDGSCVRQGCISSIQTGIDDQFTVKKSGVTVSVKIGNFDLGCFIIDVKLKNADGTLSDVLNLKMLNSVVSFDSCDQSICTFKLTISHLVENLSQQILIDRTIEVNGQNLASSDMILSTIPIKFSIDSKLQSCIGDGCSFSDTAGKLLTVSLFQYFQVKLIVQTPTFQSWKVRPGTVKMKGQGTLVQLVIENSDNTKVGEITYNISVQLATFGSMSLVVDGILEPPTARRMLMDQNNLEQQMASTLDINLTQPSNKNITITNSTSMGEEKVQAFVMIIGLILINV